MLVSTNSNVNDTIVALATPTGKGAIGVIRVSGSQALTITDTIFVAKNIHKILEEQPSHTLVFGDIKKEETVLDEVLVSVFHNPHSYTGENAVEISCHGSAYIISQIIALLIDKGCRMANPGEFTSRAFLNGKLDLAQAEAVGDLIASETATAHRVALHQMKGGFSQELSDLREKLVRFAALIELELDFSQEDVEFVDRSQFNDMIDEMLSIIQCLVISFKLGNVIKKGIPITIVGAPNAGKSTLLNALLNEERALVSPIAGTTRDTIEDVLIIQGVQFRFIDTAGIRQTNDTVEKMGIERTFDKIKQSQIVLYVIDSKEYRDDSKDLEKQFSELVKNYPKQKIIAVFNKEDIINEVILSPSILEIPTVSISALNKKGIDQLCQLLFEYSGVSKFENQTIVVNTRHYESLQQTLEALQTLQQGLKSEIPADLLTLDIKEAISHLGQITGYIDVDKDILGTIFGSFCIGK